MFNICTSDQPMSRISVVRVLLFCSLHRRIGFSQRRLNRCLESQFLWSLWTTGPVLEIDFVRSSGVVTPVEPTLFKHIRRINRCSCFYCCRLYASVKPTRCPCARRFNRCVYRALFQLHLRVVCFHSTSRLFLGLFCGSVAPL